MKLSMLYFTLAMCFLFGPLAVSLAQCRSSPQPASAEQLLSVLHDGIDTPPQERDGACITFAIKQLENKYSDEATMLLIGYLDFERPLDDAEKAGFMFHGPPSIENSYPATGTLMSFGKPAVAALLAAITDASSTLVQRNATYTFMQIFRDEPQNGIKILGERSVEGSPIQSERLRVAAQEALRWCGRSHLDACKSAENGLQPKDN
jgi:hypothetical protein